MSMYGKQSLKKPLTDSSSPATSYLLSILEEKSRGSTLCSAGSASSRAHAAFSALDEILSHCGIYTPALKVIREELADAVYSETYTTSSRPDQSTSLERVPYFLLLQRLKGERNDSKDLLGENQEKYEAAIKKLKQKIQDKDESISELKQEIDKLRLKAAEISTVVIEKNEEIEKLEAQISRNQFEAEEKMSSLRSNIHELKAFRHNLQQEMEGLRPYKVSYHTLKDTFDLPPDKRPRRGFRRPVVSTKKTQLLSSIEAASKLEQQMIELQTKSLEEYDLFLEDVKMQLSMKKFADNENDQKFFTEELQLESLGDEMSSKLKNFQRLISGSVVELELIRQHRDSLQSQLSQMEAAEHLTGGDAASNAGTLPPSSMAGGPGSSRMMTHDEVGKKTSLESQISMESGLEEDTTPLVDPNTDPFNPQERLLSKYSAMIYTSVNAGKTFDEISTAKFCKSCGEKTVVCPHKITKSDLLVQLPNGCSHIKVSRPMIRINISVLPQNGSNDAEPLQNHGKWYSRIPEVKLWNESEADLSVRRQLNPLWQDAKRRAGIDVISGASSVCATRELTKSRTLSLLEQFYASLIWNDEHLLSHDESATLRGYLYNFMGERYHDDEISTVAAYDFITSIVKYAEYDKTIYILGLALSGLLDGCVARYVLLVSDLITEVEWKETSDFYAFAGLLYSALEEDDLEQFVMEFRAFSENKISKTLVLGYIVNAITKNKEPRIQDAELKLSESSMKEKGYMDEQEFKDAMENICPLASEVLLSRLLHECLLTTGSQVVAINRLSSVTAYLSLLQVWQLLRMQVHGKVETARNKRSEATFSKLQKSKSLQQESGALTTMTQVKLLAGNISRLRQSGSGRSQQSFHDESFWSSRPNTRDSLF